MTSEPKHSDEIGGIHGPALCEVLHPGLSHAESVAQIEEHLARWQTSGVCPKSGDPLSRGLTGITAWACNENDPCASCGCDEGDCYCPDPEPSTSPGEEG